MKLTQYGRVGDIAEVQAIRTHANGRQERFQLFLAIAPDMVKAGGKLYPGAALTARGDRLKLTEFEREYVEYSVNEGGVLKASTAQAKAKVSDPAFTFEVVSVGRHAVHRQVGQAHSRNNARASRPSIRH
ncbi:hypothetical protein [Ralstonia pseudosolanacearum]|uniref:hypothetical protein n=1 Tax=Ralstonia pseudosolanacearum TaxID=1310165 RepID=UPI003CF65ED3